MAGGFVKSFHATVLARKSRSFFRNWALSPEDDPAKNEVRQKNLKYGYNVLYYLFKFFKNSQKYLEDDYFPIMHEAAQSVAPDFANALQSDSEIIDPNYWLNQGFHGAINQALMQKYGLGIHQLMGSITERSILLRHYGVE